jgi:predicted nucleic acid-binding protein
MNLVVDSNIAFSAMLNTDSQIAQLLIHSANHLQFFSIEYLKVEIDTHKDKILKYAKYDSGEFRFVKELIFSKIIFIDEAIIPQRTVNEAIKIMTGGDIDDTYFVALTKMLNATLWTGDKELTAWLAPFNYIETISTNELYLALKAIEARKKRQ